MCLWCVFENIGHRVEMVGVFHRGNDHHLSLLNNKGLYMNIIERIKNICLTPKTEWPVIAAETSSAKALIVGYILPLATLSAVAGFMGNTLIGQSLPFIGTYRTPFVTGIGIAVFTVIMAIVGTFILSWVINGLASTFGGEKNSQQAFKLAVYAYTPAWVAGLLYILPSLTFLALFASLYGLYLLYLGLPLLMKSSADKSFRYTGLVVISAVVLSAIMSMAMAMITGSSIMMGGARQPVQTDVQFDQESPLGKLQAFSKNMEAVGKKMETAEKQGTPEQQMQVAMEGLGAMLGGGKAVDPINIEQLKTFIPETFAGLPKKSSRAEKNGALGLMVSKAEASYGNDANVRVTLEISDLGGASGLLGLASWVNVEDEKEDEYGSEKTQKINGRMVHEKSSKNGNTEFSIVIAERFMVKTEGQGVDIATLKSAVTGLDLNKLETIAKQK